MRRVLLIAWLASASLTLMAQRAKISRVFASEPQNQMAAQIPDMLLDAYANGDIAAYYPNSLRRPVPLAQFYKHFGERGKAVAVLTAGPDWFCGSTSEGMGDVFGDCFSTKFEIGTATKNGKPEPVFVRLIFSATCDPRGIDIQGPVFMLSDMMKLTGSNYRIANPQNQAMSYSVSDILLLRLYADRVPLDGR